MQYFLTVVSVFLITAFNYVNAQPQPNIVEGLQLAKQYNQSQKNEINVADYWVSEKLDGIRARWNGTELHTRNGNKIFAPAWFTANWPKATIDGELWIGRGEFELTASIVLSKLTHVEPYALTSTLSTSVASSESHPDINVAEQNASSKRWAKVRFMAFDMPMEGVPFDERLNALNSLDEATPNSTFAVISQFKLLSIDALEAKLEQITKEGGEGLMLHHGKAMYTPGRSNKLLKIKRFEDAEARVLAHLPGKGRFKGMMGSLLVETQDGIQFKLGTGFSEDERQSPPVIGSWVTFKFYGVTKNGKPRFASYLRTRPSDDLPK
ncbi:DNA ligase [Alteromonas gracilis]|uniref:DNA ligase n=1 Tax=Alteromonas gracilis TaxID=1479524 RepID=UPI003734FC5F